MANTLTGLIPDLYAALDKVSRELTGYIPAVSHDLSGTQAALNENITVHVAPTAAAADITPAMVLTEPADQIIAPVSVAITKSRSVPFAYTGEEQRGLNNGAGYLSVQANMMAQAMRTLVNEVEVDTALETARTASRAYGVAGTTPFASTLDDIAEVKKILKDNGAPMGDLQYVMDTSAGAALYKLTQLTNVNEAGDDGLLRQGMIGARPLNGMSLRESGNSANLAGNAIVGTVTVTGANAIGATTINITTAAASSLTALKGDFIVFAGDTNKYVIAADVTIGASTTGDVIIAAPGLLIATAGTEAVTGSAAFVANSAFDKGAIQLVTRAPAMPEEGDARIDSTVIQDPMSGLAFEVSVWAGQRKVRYEVALAWGVKGIKPEHVVTNLG